MTEQSQHTFNCFAVAYFTLLIRHQLRIMGTLLISANNVNVKLFEEIRCRLSYAPRSCSLTVQAGGSLQPASEPINTGLFLRHSNSPTNAQETSQL